MSDTFDHAFEAYTEYDGPDFNIDTREEANEAAYIDRADEPAIDKDEYMAWHILEQRKP